MMAGVGGKGTAVGRPPLQKGGGKAQKLLENIQWVGDDVEGIGEHFSDDIPRIDFEIVRRSHEAKRDDRLAFAVFFKKILAQGGDSFGQGG